jgi:citrate lyase beta subunit
VNAVTLREVLESGGANVLAITPSHLDLINQAGFPTPSQASQAEAASQAGAPRRTVTR